MPDLTSGGKRTSGEHSVRRALPDLRRAPTEWRQTMLWPQELVTVRLDVGWYRPEGVGMFSGEVYITDTRELLAMTVRPFVKDLTLGQHIAEAQAWQKELLHDVFDPPF